MQTRIHAIISGTVQGVFYRASTQNEAKKLDLKGFVRNLPDGTVELEAQGESTDIDTLLDWCWQGPPDCKVTRVTSEVIARVPGGGVFEIRR
ncbi:MAG: acylphosphatase [Saprospiraceae bacterium]